MTLRDHVRELIRRLRRVENLSAFAQASGVSRATLYRIMEGWANATIENLCKIEDQLKRESKE